jgi:uncharacterized membrane protein YjjP (DUF1212 family)
VPSEQVQHDAAASQFVATLGAAMAAANYPVAMVRGLTEQTSRAYGLDHQFLALPNYVRVGSPTGEAMYIANPDFDVRYDQSFPLAQLVARAPAGAISREEGMAELEPIRNQRRRFPPWVTVLGYAVQSTGLALILQPTSWSLVGAASLGLLVGALSVLGRRIDAIGYLMLFISRRADRLHLQQPLARRGRGPARAGRTSRGCRAQACASRVSC